MKLDEEEVVQMEVPEPVIDDDDDIELLDELDQI